MPISCPRYLTKDFNIRETTADKWLTFEQVNNEENFDIEELRGTVMELVALTSQPQPT